MLWPLRYTETFSLSGQCRTLKFGPTTAFIGERLINHVIRVTDVITDELCMTLCYVEPNCVSFNFKMAASDNGNHKCELNNSTHEGYENDMSKNPNYKYHGAEVRNVLHLIHSLLEKISLRIFCLLFFNPFQCHTFKVPVEGTPNIHTPQKNYTNLQK